MRFCRDGCPGRQSTGSSLSPAHSASSSGRRYSTSVVTSTIQWGRIWNSLFGCTGSGEKGVSGIASSLFPIQSAGRRRRIQSKFFPPEKLMASRSSRHHVDSSNNVPESTVRRHRHGGHAIFCGCRTIGSHHRVFRLSPNDCVVAGQGDVGLFPRQECMGKHAQEGIFDFQNMKFVRARLE